MRPTAGPCWSPPATPGGPCTGSRAPTDRRPEPPAFGRISPPCRRCKRHDPFLRPARYGERAQDHVPHADQAPLVPRLEVPVGRRSREMRTIRKTGGSVKTEGLGDGSHYVVTEP